MPGKSLVAAAAVVIAPVVLSAQRQPSRFTLEEASIARIHAALKARTLTCRQVVAHYLRRMDAFDKKGPAINAIVQINTRAADEASTNVPAGAETSPSSSRKVSSPSRM
jgi:hypothetical protein